MKIYTLLVLIKLVLCQDQFELIFHDEFDEEAMDQGKWEIDNEIFGCGGNKMNQLNCNTNRSDNLILADNVLAIKAIKQQYMGNKMKYTSAKIITLEPFTYGRFEIRAALPAGKMLRPAIFLFPTAKETLWPEQGQVDIMTYTQNDTLIGTGIHFRLNGKRQYNNEVYNTSANLNNFNTYAIEWTKTEFRWFFNEIIYRRFNLSQTLGPNGSPFDKPFQLVIHLGVGGGLAELGAFPGQELSWYDHYFWKCSALILDYVRVYKWLENDTGPMNVTLLNNTLERVSVQGICSDIMPLSGTSLIIIALLILLLIIFMPFLICFIVRQVKLRRLNTYDDHIVLEDNDNYVPDDYDIPYDVGFKNSENSTNDSDVGSDIGLNNQLSSSHLSIANKSKQNSYSNVSHF